MGILYESLKVRLSVKVRTAANRDSLTVLLAPLSPLQMDRSPLHVAAERGHTHVVEVLTEKFKSNVLARTKVLAASICRLLLEPHLPELIAQLQG